MSAVDSRHCNNNKAANLNQTISDDHTLERVRPVPLAIKSHLYTLINKLAQMALVNNFIVELMTLLFTDKYRRN